ncbi:DUF4124 domain-containing protein [Pseudomonas segetis]|uniref:Beta-barrel assembly machine subunit BamE n=1 Tax=Pseudomonas segetis TaxID=298908 RepID=A0A239BUL1_9PSED|nr:DUF4124 domain-containing protein [Pseudomonas segetis]SNS11725.1 Beta-barrel assembly machine subunit BamE [Pseudomonas segetis]
MHRLSILALCSLVILPPDTWAARVFRCEDSQGNLTFTSHGCPSEHKLRLVNPQNPTPSSGKAIPLATPRHRDNTQTDSTTTVVGERQDGCGNRVTGRQRRSAIIKKQILAGMTKADVESALGKPQRVDRKNGQVRYHYQDLQGNKSQVSFDQAGCVKGN